MAWLSRILSSATASSLSTFDWVIFAFGVVMLFVFVPMVAYVRFSPRYRSDPGYARWRAFAWFWFAFGIFNFINGLFRILHGLSVPAWVSGTLFGIAVLSMIAGIVLSIREWLRIKS
jgi:hypothetical protein